MPDKGSELRVALAGAFHNIRHQHLASLGRYVQLGEQTSAQVTADADPAARRRPR